MTPRPRSPTRTMPTACLTAALTLYAFAGPQPARARDLVVAMPAGGLVAAERASLFKNFTASTGIPLSVRVADEPDAPPPDLALLQGDQVRAACQAGSLTKIDWDALGGRDKYWPQGVPTQGVPDCGLGAVIVTSVLAWDRDKFPATPTWQDFWDIAKLPGKRGLRAGVRTTLEIALMADGVAPGDVYKTLRADDGIDRAFRKLDQLRPYIVWWRTGAEAARILGSGDVLLTVAPNGEVARVATGQQRNLGLQWNGSLVSVLSWAARKASDETGQIAQFLKAAADPANQAALQTVMPQGIPYGGLAPGANEHLPPEIATYSSGLPAHLAAGLPVDEAFWQDNLAKLTQRFEAWVK